MNGLYDGLDSGLRDGSYDGLQQGNLQGSFDNATINGYPALKPRTLRVNKAGINRGLVGYWSMMEGAGTLVRDISGNGNNGTATNFAMSGATSNWVDSPLGGCLNFDGTDDFVGCGNSSSIQCIAEVTLSVWINPSVQNSTRKVIISNDDGISRNYAVHVDAGSTGIIQFRWGGLNINSTGNILTLNKWNFIVCVRSGATGNWAASIYLNGVLRSSTTTATDPGGTFITHIGRQIATFPFTGSIDEVRIYNRALSQVEVFQLYVRPHAKFLM